MKREIKFRAWDNVNKRMGYFDPGFHWQDEYDLWCLRLKFGSVPITNVPCEDNIDLMQYTGLKDKNGREVFEGDVLQARYVPNYSLNIFEVKWNNGSAAFVCYRSHQDQNIRFEQLPLCPSNSMEDLEVIGNIYENPELIK